MLTAIDCINISIGPDVKLGNWLSSSPAHTIYLIANYANLVQRLLPQECQHIGTELYEFCIKHIFRKWGMDAEMIKSWLLIVYSLHVFFYIKSSKLVIAGAGCFLFRSKARGPHNHFLPWVKYSTLQRGKHLLLSLEMFTLYMLQWCYSVTKFIYLFTMVSRIKVRSCSFQ